MQNATKTTTKTTTGETYSLTIDEHGNCPACTCQGGDDIEWTCPSGKYTGVNFANSNPFDGNTNANFLLNVSYQVVAVSAQTSFSYTAVPKPSAYGEEYPDTTPASNPVIIVTP